MAKKKNSIVQQIDEQLRSLKKNADGQRGRQNQDAPKKDAVKSPDKNAANAPKKDGQASGQKRPRRRSQNKAPRANGGAAAAVQSVPTARVPESDNRQKGQREGGKKLRIIPLGGVDGIGKNITVFEYDDDMIVVDCGLSFPEDSMPGVDLVIPDTTYIEENAQKMRGLILTHGHEDHIGAVPYFLKKLNVPVYATRLTLGILEGKLEEHGILSTSHLIEQKAGDVIKLGVFTVEFIRVTHSIPDSVALCIETPVGRVIHTGDFKIDLTPARGESIDLGRLAELGKKGVRLLMCDSTNVERAGYTPTERVLYQSFDRFFAQKEKRIVIATFSSNVHRIQQIINTSAKHGRKVAVTGRSMLNILGAATRLGYIDIPEGILIDVGDMKKYSPGELTLITTGSQGEPLSALYRMAFGEHSQVSVGSGDMVILSSSPIPGNEKMISNIVNELLKRGADVVNDVVAEVHVSGHACAEELKIMHALTNPETFIPVHGEYKHLKKHADLARSLGMADKDILIPQTGRVIELGKKSLCFGGDVTSGAIMVDGYSVGDVGVTVLRDRRHLAEDGILIIVAALDQYSHAVITGPDISTKGFVYAKESEAFLDELRRLAQKSIERCVSKGIVDMEGIKLKVREELSSVIYQRTKRRPMIMPIFMEMPL